jgi:c(7)-type cytochrome triheme protein
VGDSGIPLSPDSIVLPQSAELLPNGLAREALGMTGLGHSLATAPPSALRPELPWIELDRLHEKVYWLSQAGRHVDLGEELFDSVAVLAAEWTGARDGDWEWDLLRRTTGRGAGFGAEVGQVLAAEAAASPDLAFERFAATTAFLGPLQGALATGDGVRLSVASRTSGKTVSGSGADPARSRGLPFADLYDLDGSQMALLAVPEDGGYRVRVTDSNGGAAALRLLVPEADGTLRTVEWSGVSLSSAGSATVDYRADDTSFTLHVDSDGDGVAESQVAGSTSTVAPRAFAVLGAAQDPVVVTGHTVEVLFSQDVDLRSLLDKDPSHFVLPGKVSNGGLVESERDVASFFEVLAENPFEGLMNTRVVRVTFDHAQHVEREAKKCETCHDKLFPQSRAPINFKAGMHKPSEAKKESCAACHVAGGKAFESKGNCNNCHVK